MHDGTYGVVHSKCNIDQYILMQLSKKSTEMVSDSTVQLSLRGSFKKLPLFESW